MISSHNNSHIWDQNTHFSERFRAEWCRTAQGVKFLLQRTLIKGKRKQEVSTGACRIRITSIIHQQQTLKLKKKKKNVCEDIKTQKHFHSYCICTHTSLHAAHTPTHQTFICEIPEYLKHI